MEYLSFLNCLNCCCKDDQAGTIKISCNLNCFKNKTYQININDDDDIENIEKIFELLDKIQRRQSSGKTTPSAGKSTGKTSTSQAVP